MATPVHDKYYLKSLHENIDLFDRKIAHLRKYDTFATEAEREASAGKMAAKRELLARTARQLAKDGVEFKTSELPRSFRTADMIPEPVSATVTVEAEVAEGMGIVPTRRLFPSPFAGTPLDTEASLLAYKRNRSKSARAQG